MGNSAEFALAFYGILKVGAIAVSISAMCKTRRGGVPVGNSESRHPRDLRRALLARGARARAHPARPRRSSSVGGGAGADLDFWELLDRHAARPLPDRLHRPRRRRRDHLHLRDHGQAQGRRAHPRQRGLERSANAHVTNDDPATTACSASCPCTTRFAQNFIFNGARRRSGPRWSSCPGSSSSRCCRAMKRGAGDPLVRRAHHLHPDLEQRGVPGPDRRCLRIGQLLLLGRLRHARRDGPPVGRALRAQDQRGLGAHRVHPLVHVQPRVPPQGGLRRYAHRERRGAGVGRRTCSPCRRARWASS